MRRASGFDLSSFWGLKVVCSTRAKAAVSDARGGCCGGEPPATAGDFLGVGADGVRGLDKASSSRPVV